MQQRLGIAQALVGDPAFVVLDEPMSGLDPIGRKEVRDLILELKRRGKTVFFSTHILPDVETLCDRVGVIIDGRLRDVGTLDALLSARVQSVEATPGRPRRRGALRRRAARRARGRSRSPGRSRRGGRGRGGEGGRRRAGGRVVALTAHRETLEDFFMRRLAGTRRRRTARARRRAAAERTRCRATRCASSSPPGPSSPARRSAASSTSSSPGSRRASRSSGRAPAARAAGRRSPGTTTCRSSPGSSCARAAAAAAAPISPRYPLVELLGAGAAWLAWPRHGLAPAALVEFAFVATSSPSRHRPRHLGAAAPSDLAARRARARRLRARAARRPALRSSASARPSPSGAFCAAVMKLGDAGREDGGDGFRRRPHPHRRRRVPRARGRSCRSCSSPRSRGASSGASLIALGRAHARRDGRRRAAPGRLGAAPERGPVRPVPRARRARVALRFGAGSPGVCPRSTPFR